MYNYRVNVPGLGWTKSADWTTTPSSSLINEARQPRSQKPKINARSLSPSKPKVDLSSYFPLGVR